MEIVAEFPPKLEPLFQRAPYKVIRGGRGGGKSWGVARALLIIGLQRPIRVLCTRETQRSIRDSVHKLLVDQIARLSFAGHYEIQQVQITGAREWETDIGPMRTEFVFAGLSDLTAASIKSFEGADICWVEEGQVVTDTSWKILLPTIRKAGAEVWVTFNPELDTDPTWERFVEHPPPGTVNIELNWRDNPWFNETLERTKLHDRATLKPYEYEWIWEGKCKPAISGAVYADEVAAMFSERRVGKFPVEASLPVFAVFDLGWADSTAIIVFQRQVSALRIVDYIEDNRRPLDWYSGELRAKPYRVQELFLPHDGANNSLTGQSAERVLQNLNWRVSVLQRQDPEEGIRQLRLAFRQLYIDEHCQRLIECLKRYRRVIPATTGEPSKPLHDEYSHGADAARYMAQAAPLTEGVASGAGLKLPKLDWKGHGWAA
jgi:phage terminase large subunit